MSVYIKVKIKSLAEEARIIKKEELKRRAHFRHCRAREKEEQLNKPLPGHLEAVGEFHALRLHRKNKVGVEARAALLCYGFLRARPYDTIEQPKHTAPPLASALHMAQRYHVTGFDSAQIADLFWDWVNLSSLPNEFIPEGKRHPDRIKHIDARRAVPAAVVTGATSPE